MGGPEPAGKSKRERLLDEMIENARGNERMTIDVRTANELLANDNVAIIDVREPDAHEREHVPGAINVPLNDLPDHVPFLPDDKDTTILSICERGNISLSSVLFLHSLGYHNARSIDGGTQRWAAEGFATSSSVPDAAPLTEPSASIS
jgi:rhodanese-related sulfurtransferase